jgi:hypothetical protein
MQNPPMTASEVLQKDGANARARGASMFDNPFYRSELMPAQTGRSLEEWTAQVEAWHLGWSMQDAMIPLPR